MSAAAYAFVWRHAASSGLTGNHLALMLAMADAAENRKAPFIAQISAGKISRMIGVSLRHVRTMLAELKESGHLQLISAGKGPLPSMYGFGRLGVICSSPLGVIPRSLLREDSTEVA